MVGTSIFMEGASNQILGGPDRKIIDLPGVQINEETIYACVPPSNSLGLVSDLWRAF